MSSFKILIAACFLVGMISSLQLTILGAAYGKADVTNQVRSAIYGDSLSITASNEVFGDSWYGYKKSLVIVYQYENYKPIVLTTPEGQDVLITQESSDLQALDSEDFDVVSEEEDVFINQENGELQTLDTVNLKDFGILGAAYGLADVTQEVQTLVQDGESDIYASNTVFTDSWVGNKKTLVIVYQNSSGLPAVEIVTEDDRLDASIFLPDLEIIKAAYGLGDVTNIVAEVARTQGGKSLNVTGSNSVFGDSWINTQKSFVVVYRFGIEDYQMAIRKENEDLILSYV